MRYLSVKEAATYANSTVPSQRSIFQNGSSLYSNFRRLMKSSEFSIPKDLDGERCGILHPLSLIWYSTNNTLRLFFYDTNHSETIPNFSSPIHHVRCFTPLPDIFQSRVSHCLLVVTERDMIIYAVDGHSLIATDFNAKIPAPVSCLTVYAGHIYIACTNGTVYQTVYNTIDLLGYKYMNLHSPRSMLESLCSLFRRRRERIADIAATGKHVISVGTHVTVYRINGGMYKHASFINTDGYVSVQILEDSPLFYCCVRSSGTRDFFGESGQERLLVKESPVEDFRISEGNGSHKRMDMPATGISAGNSYLSLSDDRILMTVPGSTTRFLLVLFNDFHLRNFSRSAPVENLESLAFYSPVRAVELTADRLLVLSDGKISSFEILSPKTFLSRCSSQDVWIMYTNYGDLEFMVRYYELLAANEDVSRLEGICRNEDIKGRALFIYLYSLIRPVFTADLRSLIKSAAAGCSASRASAPQQLDLIVNSLKNVKKRLPLHYTEARSFVDEFVQTHYYVTILSEYSVPYTQSFESVLTGDGTFRMESLRLLLAAVSLAQSIEPLIKTMKNNCPLYLPLDQVNLQRGTEYLDKQSGDYLAKSLECFREASLNRTILSKYNSMGFYYGSVVLIRDKFEFSYEEAVSLLRESVRCRCAMDAGLASSNEYFLYPFFEALLETEKFVPCKCNEDADLALDLLRIENPVFLTFLRDKSIKAEKAYQLYWKYLLFWGRNIEAVEAIVGLSEQPFPDFREKIELLKMALTIATGIDQKSSRGSKLIGKIKLMIRMSQIQEELVERDKSVRTNTLLNPDTLYNDYCVEYPDLGLKVLDAIDYSDKKALKRLYSRYLEDKGLDRSLAFLSELTNKRLELVIDELVGKMGTEEDFCRKLEASGFADGEIVTQVESSLQRVTHPDTKGRLLRSYERFVGREGSSGARSYCEQAFGFSF